MEACKQIQELLPFYLDEHILTGEERQRVEAHVVHCPECRQELTDYQNNAALLQMMGRSIFHAPSDLADNVIQTLKKEKHTSSPVTEIPLRKEKSKIFTLSNRRYFFSGIAAAAVLAMVCVGVPQLLPGNGVSSTQVAQNTPATEEVSTSTAPTEIAKTTEHPTVAETPAPLEEIGATEPTVQPDATETTAESVPMDTTLPETAAPADSSENAENVQSTESTETTEIIEKVPTEPVSPPVVVAQSESVNETPVATVLLNEDKKLRSTLLKMSFADVDAAVQKIQEQLQNCHGELVDITTSSDSSCEILTAMVPCLQADGFLVSVTELGFVISQEENFKTSLYSQLMEEYLQLQTQFNAVAASSDEAIKLKTQLAEVEQQMNTAKEEILYESVVIWVQLGE